MSTKKKVLTLFIACSIILSACGSATETKEPATDTKVETSDQSTNTAQTDTTTNQEVVVEDSATGKQVNTYKALMDELGKAKEGNAVDWDKVLSSYQETLQAAVSEADEQFDVSITAAIEAGKNQELDANVARQIVDKVTQSYFYQKQKKLNKDIITAIEEGKTDVAKQSFEELKYLASEVLIPTAAKRDEYYGADMQLQIENGLSLLETALNEGNAENFAVYSQITDKTFYRSYYLAANSYAEKIEKGVAEGKDQVSLQIMQAEGWGFLQAIKGSLSGGDEAAAATLEKTFNLAETEVASIKAEEVSNLFVQAFVGKIKGYHEKAPKELAEGKTKDAKVHAMEANIFLKAIELKAKDKLGEEATTALFADAQSWYEAIAAGDQEKVKEFGEKVVLTLDTLTK